MGGGGLKQLTCLPGMAPTTLPALTAGFVRYFLVTVQEQGEGDPVGTEDHPDHVLRAEGDGDGAGGLL